MIDLKLYDIRNEEEGIVYYYNEEPFFKVEYYKNGNTDIILEYFGFISNNKDILNKFHKTGFASIQMDNFIAMVKNTFPEVKTINIIVSPYNFNDDFNHSKSTLSKWYEKFGFQSIKGSNCMVCSL